MGSEVRVIETPGFDLNYWLCRCEGFEVETPEGRLGIVHWVVFDTRHDCPDALAVRTGHLVHHSLLIAATAVTGVLPTERRITLDVNPVPVGRIQTLRRRLARDTTNQPSSPPLT